MNYSNLPKIIKQLEPDRLPKSWVQDERNLNLYWFYINGKTTHLLATVHSFKIGVITLENYNLSGEEILIELKTNNWDLRKSDQNHHQHQNPKKLR
jgi:hypothetical protein